MAAILLRLAGAHALFGALLLLTPAIARWAGAAA
ncbi:MAG: hypothetical protein JWL91_2154 [Sphingomonas bacterium]|jgi:hypothetical protein|nr:hypothetical protein [Sphingomonas bacterium]